MPSASLTSPCRHRTAASPCEGKIELTESPRQCHDQATPSDSGAATSAMLRRRKSSHGECGSFAPLWLPSHPNDPAGTDDESLSTEEDCVITTTGSGDSLDDSLDAAIDGSSHRRSHCAADYRDRSYLKLERGISFKNHTDSMCETPPATPSPSLPALSGSSLLRKSRCNSHNKSFASLASCGSRSSMDSVMSIRNKPPPIDTSHVPTFEWALVPELNPRRLSVKYLLVALLIVAVYLTQVIDVGVMTLCRMMTFPVIIHHDTGIAAVDLNRINTWREKADAASAFKGPAVGTVDEVAVDVSGEELLVRIYTPGLEDENGVEVQEQLPVAVYMHGGGFCTGTIDGFDGVARSLARSLGMVVASLEYSLAPEATWERPITEGVAALKWIQAHAQEFGGDPSRIVLVGEDAGGALCASVALANSLADAKENHVDMCGTVLVYPLLDAHQRSSSYELVSSPAVPVSREEIAHQWELRLGGDPAAADDYRAQPLLAPAALLRNLPPTLVIAAEVDVARGDAEQFVKRLRNAGALADLQVMKYATRGFLGRGMDGGRASIQAVKSFLQHHCGG